MLQCGMWQIAAQGTIFDENQKLVAGDLLSVGLVAARPTLALRVRP